MVRTGARVAGRVLVSGFSLAALLAAMLLLAKPAHAATFTVNSMGDQSDSNLNDPLCDVNPRVSGSTCTLRAAIQEANHTSGTDTINFEIVTVGGPAVKTISPASPLPAINGRVTIDGYTQPGASPNTLTRGTNAVPLIELNGANAGAANGLTFNASDSLVRGLVINRFTGAGVVVNVGNRISVKGNFIGTDPSGTVDLGNSADGVLVNANSDNGFVGGTLTADRNLISGNGGNGIGIALDGESLLNSVQGNCIGTKKDGRGALGNSGDGVRLGASLNDVGGTASGAANTIAFNGGDGVSVVSGSGSTILSNSIFSNGGLGIDLLGGTENASGATANDPKDPDTGPNDLQNKPVLTSATTTSGGTTTIQGRLNSTPNKTFTLQFFSNGAGNEGKTFIGRKNVTTDANGDASFTFVPAGAVPAGQTITATATDPGGNTSEFSGPRIVVVP